MFCPYCGTDDTSYVLPCSVKGGENQDEWMGESNEYQCQSCGQAFVVFEEKKLDKKRWVLENTFVHGKNVYPNYLKLEYHVSLTVSHKQKDFSASAVAFTKQAAEQKAFELLYNAIKLEKSIDNNLS